MTTFFFITGLFCYFNYITFHGSLIIFHLVNLAGSIDCVYNHLQPSKISSIHGMLVQCPCSIVCYRHILFVLLFTYNGKIFSATTFLEWSISDGNSTALFCWFSYVISLIIFMQVWGVPGGYGWSKPEKILKHLHLDLRWNRYYFTSQIILLSDLPP